MDLHLHDAEPTAEERDAVDALLGAPTSGWDGGDRDAERDTRVAFGGHAARSRRDLLLPALQSVQARVGWVSEGALNYVCTRLTVPPADAWGVATFYALLATTPRPRRVLHVCDDIACRCRGANELIAALETNVGSAHHAPKNGQVEIGAFAWMRSPCLGMCDQAPAVLLQEAGPVPRERLYGGVGAAAAQELLESVIPIAAGQSPGVTPSAARQSPGVIPSEARDLHYMSRRADPSSASPPRDDSERASPPRDDSKRASPPRDDSERASPPRDDSERASPPRDDVGPQLKLLTKRIGLVDPESLESYRASAGYVALPKAFDMGREAVIAEVTASKLMGRGGAAFPTGRKWDAVAKQTALPHYLVCNADESEPGTFKDRVLMEEDPFGLVEAMTIAAFATGCELGYIYVRGEYPLARERVANAVAHARRAGLLGADIMGRGVRFDIEIRRGAGAYICGEETALFNSIEGLRGEPRNKPPFPVQAGLFGKPTVVNNVETLMNVPHILAMGGEAFARIGTDQSTGTRLFCVSGCVTRPGLYEMPSGVTARTVLETAGGVANGRPLRAVLLGGAAGVFIRPDELDMRMTFEDTRAAKATLGSGVFMVFDDRVDLGDTLRRIAAFFRDESCGQCVPCRVGTVRQEEALHRLHARRTIGGVPAELALLAEVGAAMKDASICGLGQTAYSAVESAIQRLGMYDGAAS